MGIWRVQRLIRWDLGVIPVIIYLYSHQFSMQYHFVLISIDAHILFREAASATEDQNNSFRCLGKLHKYNINSYI